MKQDRISFHSHYSQTSQNCYDQLSTCYDTAGPTGHKGCTAWEAYCGQVKNGCSAGKFNGPPSADSYIPPPEKNLDELDLKAAAPIIVGDESSSDTSDTYPAPQTNPDSGSAVNTSGGSIDTCGSNGGLKCATGLCCSSHG